MVAWSLLWARAIFRAVALCCGGTTVPATTPPRQRLVGSPLSLPMVILFKHARVAAVYFFKYALPALPIAVWHAASSGVTAAGGDVGVASPQNGVASQVSPRPSASAS